MDPGPAARALAVRAGRSTVAAHEACEAARLESARSPADIATEGNLDRWTPFVHRRAAAVHASRHASMPTRPCGGRNGADGPDVPPVPLAGV